jgi:hypothetical protein
MLPRMRPGVRPQRHSVSLFVSSGDEPVPFGRTRDLSVTGIFVETDKRPQVGGILNIGFVWGEDALVCAARVVRHASDGIGLMFMNPDAFFLRAVSEILDATPPIRVVSGFAGTS